MAVRIDRDARTVAVDFTGTSEQRPANFNAPRSVVRAAVLYVLRLVVGEAIPLNDGFLRPVTIVVPDASMLSPRFPAAVVAGNAETSQAATDALLGALGVMARSQATMNNLIFACQAWEPGGDEFRSSALTEALSMSRVLGAAFPAWFAAFLPDLARGDPATLFAPVHVSDRSDGKIAHLDGLNLSRAWCWRGIAHALGEAHPLAPDMEHAAARHLAASLPHIADDYVGTHWLASFALLVLMA